MSAFIVLAALLTLATAIGIVWPMLRGKEGRIGGLVTVALVAVSAAALYAYSSHWTWPEDAGAANSPAAMVSKLARRLEREPDDVAGWLMLGRSYSALGQYPLAQRAYQRANRLEGGRNPEAIIGAAEAMVMQANGAVDERTGRLFEQALELAPESEKALFFSAVAAQRRGDAPLAIARFEKMLALDPPQNIRLILQEQIDRLRGTGAGGGTADGAGEAKDSVSVSMSSPASTPRIAVKVSVKPELAASVAPGATLFVFVRAPGRPGPPLAVKRLPAKLPVAVELTAADSMVPGLSFTAGDTVEVSAKISADGSATPKGGDPIGRLSYKVGSDQEKPLVIDGLSQ